MTAPQSKTPTDSEERIGDGDPIEMPPGLRELAAQFGDAEHPKFPIAYPRPTTLDIVAMGGYLCGVKENLGHGKFIAWVKAECPFSYRTAHRYMRAYRGFCILTKSDTMADLKTTEGETT
jgi:Protein of unknown function (DUF3102)